MPSHRCFCILVLDLNGRARLHICREAELVGVVDTVAVQDVRRVPHLRRGSNRHSHVGVKDTVSIIDILKRLH